jgi:hypothetical protein
MQQKHPAAARITTAIAPPPVLNILFYSNDHLQKSFGFSTL